MSYIRYDPNLWIKFARRHGPHGPHAPCPKSPTGEHCWHNMGYGGQVCCHCGARR